MKKIIAVYFVFIGIAAFAQDTITVMHYNLLNYGNTTSYCTTSNNNLADKDGYLKTILSYIHPDILEVNEIAGNTYIIGHLLDSCLNINGINYYQHANYVNTNSSDIVSMLYYNSDNFVLQSQETVTTSVRDILLYKLYYRSYDLYTGDTAFLIPISAHLKAGSSTSDENERASMAAAMMTHLNNIGSALNYMLSGDLNLKTSAEQAYQNLINDPNTSISFHDPINQPGNWYSNSNFASIHTQSTHTVNNGCAATGGMDDRFDIILLNNNIITGSDHYQYIPGSYKAVGNDGQHFNLAINASPTNTSVPPNVLDALYNMSDHLPVVLDLYVDKTLVSVPSWTSSGFKIKINNPVRDQINLSITAARPGILRLSLLTLQGWVVFEKSDKLIKGPQKWNIPVSDLTPGMYLLRFEDEFQQVQVLKVIKS